MEQASRPSIARPAITSEESSRAPSPHGTVDEYALYASGSDYGLTGPDRDNLAMDLTIQAVSGLIAATGFPDGPPVKAGPAVVDFISGIHLYAATLTALFERERTGRGRLVEVTMQEAAYATLTSLLHAYFETGQSPPRTGNASHGRAR
jgi:CoA:oxalate CoA-transferase